MCRSRNCKTLIMVLLPFRFCSLFPILALVTIAEQAAAPDIPSENKPTPLSKSANSAAGSAAEKSTGADDDQPCVEGQPCKKVDAVLVPSKNNAKDAAVLSSGHAAVAAAPGGEHHDHAEETFHEHAGHAGHEDDSPSAEHEDPYTLHDGAIPADAASRQAAHEAEMHAAAQVQNVRI